MAVNPEHPTAQNEVLDWFNSLAPVDPGEMVGLWRGIGHPSGHPLDGVLENLDWFGKRFHTNMRADALLFEGAPGELLAIEPAYFPIRRAMDFAGLGRRGWVRNLFSHLKHRLRAHGTTASLRLRMDEGVLTAAMEYDRQPIVDFFRQSPNGAVIGKMVVDGDPRRYFFRLEKIDGGSSPTKSL